MSSEGVPGFCMNRMDSEDQSVLKNVTEQTEPSIRLVQWISYQIIAPVIISVGLFGNVANLVVLTRPALQDVTYFYLSGLAMTDVAVMIMEIPLNVRLSDNQSTSYAAALFHAHFELFLVNALTTASVFIVTCLTVDRYISVCSPTTFRTVHTKKNARMAIIFGYCVAVIMHLPLTAMKMVCQLDKQAEECPRYSFHENLSLTDTTYWSIYMWGAPTVTRFIPSVLLSVLNILIIRKFRQLKTKRRQRAANIAYVPDPSSTDTATANPRSQSANEEQRLIVILRAIVILFFVTITPSAILFSLYTERRDPDLGFQIFRAVANNLELLNCALNFYVYFLCSKKFRGVFIRVFSDCFAWPKKAKAKEGEGTRSNNRISDF